MVSKNFSLETRVFLRDKAEYGIFLLGQETRESASIDKVLACCTVPSGP
jgi:hypothetical protein